MSGEVKILGLDGKPMPRPKPSALVGGGTAPYDAADIYSNHMAAWRPYLWSPDGELNMYRDRIVSRVRDLVRNDGWATGGVTSMLDNAIGANFRPVSKPDYRALAAYSGNSAFDPVWADEFGKAVEAGWRSWANDPGKYCDASRNQVISQIMYLGFRHYLIDGDALAILHWLPQRQGIGRARYATSVQIVDPDRLSNPQLKFDDQVMRGGVEVDEYGAATAYHIRRAHQGDWFSAAKSVTWDRIERETSWGRPVIVHFYELDRAGQHRGGAGVLTPVLQRMRMLTKYDTAEMDAALLNAVFGAYIQSPFDHELIEGALGDAENLNKYQDMRASFHDKRRLMVGSAVMPTLFPGESINTVNAARPTSNFPEFQASFLRNAASGMGTSYEQLSKDWSRTNYSSARSALLEVWKTMHRRRINFGIGFASPIYRGWLEEAMEVDDLPLPNNAPEFIECVGAYTACRWMGPGRGWVDPVKEKQAAILGVEAGLSTMEEEAAEQGKDWEDVLRQREIEVRRYRDAGVPLPNWARMSTDYEDKPEQEAGGAPP